MLFVFAGLSPCKHASAEKFEARHLVTKHPRGLGLHGDDLCSQRLCRPRFRLRSCYQLFHRDDGAFAEPRLVPAREVDFPRCKAFLEDAAVVIALQQSWFWASSRVQYASLSTRSAFTRFNQQVLESMAPHATPTFRALDVFEARACNLSLQAGFELGQRTPHPNI